MYICHDKVPTTPRPEPQSESFWIGLIICICLFFLFGIGLYFIIKKYCQRRSYQAIPSTTEENSTQTHFTDFSVFESTSDDSDPENRRPIIRHPLRPLREISN